jgi:hypothetical protein
MAVGAGGLLTIWGAIQVSSGGGRLLVLGAGVALSGASLSMSAPTMRHQLALAGGFVTTLGLALQLER